MQHGLLRYVIVSEAAAVFLCGSHQTPSTSQLFRLRRCPRPGWCVAPLDCDSPGRPVWVLEAFRIPSVEPVLAVVSLAATVAGMVDRQSFTAFVQMAPGPVFSVVFGFLWKSRRPRPDVFCKTVGLKNLGFRAVCADTWSPQSYPQGPLRRHVGGLPQWPPQKTGRTALPPAARCGLQSGRLSHPPSPQEFGPGSGRFGLPNPGLSV